MKYRNVDGEARRIRGIRVCREQHTDPDLSWLTQSYEGEDIFAEEAAKYRTQDAERIAAYDRGEWWMVGVWAEASVVIGGVIQTLQSGGLWGIESDSDESYFTEVAEDELDALRDILRECGFADAAIDAAYEGVAA